MNVNAKCTACGHGPFAAATMPMSVREFTKAMRDAKCPKCGAGNDKLELASSPGKRVKDVQVVR